MIRLQSHGSQRFWQCDVCIRVFEYSLHRPRQPDLSPPNYCPFCGAREDAKPCRCSHCAGLRKASGRGDLNTAK